MLLGRCLDFDAGCRRAPGGEANSWNAGAFDYAHPEVREYRGKHLTVTNRTPTEVALAKLIDAAIDYELTRYGQRHLYCHTSWTHVGPLADRPDIEVKRASTLVPDMGDLWCMNVYTYARGVKTSPPGSVTWTRHTWPTSPPGWWSATSGPRMSA